MRLQKKFGMYLKFSEFSTYDYCMLCRKCSEKYSGGNTECIIKKYVNSNLIMV